MSYLVGGRTLGYQLQDDEDDFVFKSLASGSIGNLNWNFTTAGGYSDIPSIQDHPGILQLTASNNTVQIYNSAKIGNDMNYFAVVVKAQAAITNMRVTVGLSVSSTLTDETANGAYFSFVPATDAHWRTITKTAAGSTANNSTVTYTAGTWYLLEILRTSAPAFVFYINRAVVATHSTSANLITSEASFPVFILTSTAAETKQLYVDYYRLQSPLVQRY